jgi:hypothetical protein
MEEGGVEVLLELASAAASSHALSTRRAAQRILAQMLLRSDDAASLMVAGHLQGHKVGPKDRCWLLPLAQE